MFSSCFDPQRAERRELYGLLELPISTEPELRSRVVRVIRLQHVLRNDRQVSYYYVMAHVSNWLDFIYRREDVTFRSVMSTLSTYSDGRSCDLPRMYVLPM